MKRHCAGRAELFRYGDDAVICCQDKRDAKRIKKALGNRLSKYGLKLNEGEDRVGNFFEKGSQQGNKARRF